MEALIEELRAEEESYVPKEEILSKLEGITVIPVIGAAGVGKSTLINFAIDAHPGFSRAISFTTRRKRPGEAVDQYRFYRHDRLPSIRRQVAVRQLVQYAVHPETGDIYGSEIDDYQTPFVMVDILSTAIAPLRKLPFKSLIEVNLACEPEAWDIRFAEYLARPDDAAKRIAEGVASLEWALDQGPEANWIDTTNTNLSVADGVLIDLVAKSQPTNPDARAVGERLYEHLQGLAA